VLAVPSRVTRVPATTFWARPPSATGSVGTIPFDIAAGKIAMTSRVYVDPDYGVGKVMPRCRCGAPSHAAALGACASYLGA